MERKRTWLRVICDEEEEEEDKEEEGWDRRISTRNRKRVRYIEDDDDDYEEDDDEEDEEEEEDEEHNEQPGPSTQNTHNQITQENRPLPVTCGKKKGFLDVERLGRGEVCIKCEGCWFSPPAFEELGGKGCSKKWKASILYENKPLQFWFEQGSLTTKGFKKRGTTTTQQKKKLSSSHISESTKESEIQSAEETQEDDGKDEDWLPGSEELTLETEEGEEERVGAENGREVVDSGVDKSEEKEDKMERGEMDDQDMPAVADNDRDNCVNEERETELMISTSEKIRESVLQKKVKVIIQRLPEFQVNSDCESSCMVPPVVGSWCTPFDEDAQNKEEEGHNSTAAEDPSVTAATHIGPSQISHPPIAGENGDEFTRSNEREEVGQREIKTETVNSPAPEPVTDTDFTGDIDFGGDMIDEWEKKEGTGHCGEEEERRRCGMGPETQRQQTEVFKDEDLDMSGSEAGGQLLANGNISDVPSNSPPIQSSIKEEMIEAMSDILVESGHDGAGLHVMKLETGVSQETQGSGSTPSSDVVEGLSTSWPSTSCNLETMDIDQLRREKIKMQIKVLKLQEEYYTQKIKGQKK